MKIRLVLLAALAVSGAVLSQTTRAGTLGWVHSFASPDGVTPLLGLTPGTDVNFYGTAGGVIYQVTPAGNFSVIYRFSNDTYFDPSSPLVAVNNDPSGKMVFYHVDSFNLARITTDGTAAGTSVSLIPSYSFNISGLLLYYGDDTSGNQVFYVSGYFGEHNRGTLCRLVTNGTAAGTTVTIVHSFGSDSDPVDGGAGALCKGSDGNLYGATSDSANPFFGETQLDNGKVFQFNPTSGAYNVLYIFPLNGPAAQPSALVEASPGVFFGDAPTTTGNEGVLVFKLTVTGSTASYGAVHTFLNDLPPNKLPLLVDADGLMYGVLQNGVTGSGELYSVTPDGTVSDIYDFTATNGTTNSDGIRPLCTLAIDADGNLYGTAVEGGTTGNGTAYRLNTPPKPPLPAFTSFDAQLTSTNDGAPIHFTATMQSGVKVTVQFSTNPTNATSWLPLLDGGVMTEQPAGSGNYVLDSAAYPAGQVTFRAVATKPGSARSTSGGKGPFTLHMKQGLSATGFTVNGSNAPQAGLTDSALRFAAKQSGAPTNLSVKVQASTDNATWADLTDNNGGRMGYDPNLAQFVLNSTSYPPSTNVWFRARATGASVEPSISNVVGPFVLSSNLVHVAPPLLKFVGNGHVADFDFVGVYPTAPTGVTVRVQISSTPADEASWQAFDQAGFATMTQTSDPTVYRYLLNKSPYPDGSNIFFRARAEKNDFNATVPGVSMPCGPFTLTSARPAQATLHVSGSSGGTGTADDPLILRGDTLQLNTDVLLGAGRTLAALALELNGEVLPQVSQGVVNVVMPVIGDHVLQARVVDDLGTVARATGALFVRVLPALTGGRPDSSSPSAPANQGAAYVAIKDGNFDDPSVWQDQNGHSGVPGFADAAFIGSHTIKSHGFLSIVASLSINGGTLVGEVDNPNSNVVEGVAPQTKCTILGSVTVQGKCILQSQKLLELDNVADMKFFAGANGLSGSIQNEGQCNIHGSAGITDIAGFRNDGTLTFLPPLDAPSLLAAAATPTIGLRVVPNLVGSGRVNSSELTKLALDGSVIVRNKVTGLIGQDGNNLIGQDGNGVISNDGGTLIGQDGNGIVAQGGGNIVGQGGGNIVAQGGGNIVAQGGGNIVAQGGLNSHGGAGRAGTNADTTPTPITLNGGEVDLDGVTLIGDVVLNGGVLSGSGAIYGSLTNNGGYITPGHSAGHLSVTGDFTQGAGGTLVIENGGFLPAQFDALLIGGTAHLGGRLDVKTINGYTPGTQDTFSPLSFSSATGSFASIGSNVAVAINDTGLTTSLDITKPQPQYGQPANISTRMKVLTDDNVLIGGFIVAGPSGSTKKVLIRGMGPTLGTYGVPGVLPDPYIELHYPNGSTATNDDWQQAANHDQIPTRFQPGPKESALLVDLAPGAYTVIEKGAHGETGVGLTEVYDFDGSTAVALSNISTRGFIDIGDNVMIGGFIVSGSEPAQILVRATGPSLTQYGISGALADPMLELHDANGNVIQNDDWRATQETEIKATTIPPSNDKEPAILAALVPGSYTAIVRGKDNSTGVGLVEAYKIK